MTGIDYEIRINLWRQIDNVCIWLDEGRKYQLISSFFAFITEKIELNEVGYPAEDQGERGGWSLHGVWSMSLVSSTIAVHPFHARSPPRNPGHWVETREVRCEMYILNCLQMNFVYTFQLTICTYFKHLYKDFFRKLFFKQLPRMLIQLKVPLTEISFHILLHLLTFTLLIFWI